jgi:hypothetical protein
MQRARRLRPRLTNRDLGRSPAVAYTGPAAMPELAPLHVALRNAARRGGGRGGGVVPSRFCTPITSPVPRPYRIDRPVETPACGSSFRRTVDHRRRRRITGFGRPIHSKWRRSSEQRGWSHHSSVTVNASEAACCLRWSTAVDSHS